MEKATSMPFSSRDSGSAFISQYCCCFGEPDGTPLARDPASACGLDAVAAFVFLDGAFYMPCEERRWDG